MITIQLEFKSIEEANIALSKLSKPLTPAQRAKTNPPVDPATLKVPMPAVPVETPVDVVVHPTVPTVPAIPTVPTVPTIPTANVIPIVPVAAPAPTPQEINTAMKLAAAKVGDAGASCFAIIRETGVGLADMTPAQLTDVLAKVQAL